MFWDPKPVLRGRLDIRQISCLQQEVMLGILSQRLFHRCMKIILTPLRIDERKYYVVPSPDGKSRLSMVILMPWIADLEEQLMIAGVKTFSCPVCCTGYDNLPEPRCFGVRTSNSITSILKAVCRNSSPWHLCTSSNRKWRNSDWGSQVHSKILAGKDSGLTLMFS